MLHKKRAWHVAHVSGPEDLAEKLTQHTWTSDQGFELGGYLFLNDSTGPDGAQEYAVVKKPQNPGEPYRQVESITFSWCGLEEGRRYVERCTAGEFDRADYVRPVEVRLLRTADEVEREPAKAEEGQASGRHEGPAVKHLWTPGHPPTREQMERAERAMAEGRRRLDDWLEWQARPDAVDFRVEGRPGEGLEFTPLTLRADKFTYDQDAEWRCRVRWRPKSFLMDAEKGEAFVKDLRDKGFRVEQQQQVTDFRVTAEGTIWKFTAETEQAREFSRKALHVEPWQWLDANTFAAEHRAAQGLLAVLEDNRWRINGPTHGQLKEETLMSTNYEANFANLTKLLGEKDHVRIENEGYMPLVVEAIWHDQISLCHYGEIDGDPARDPEVVFLIEGNQAKPIYFRNDYVGVEHATVPDYFGNVPVKPRLQHSLDSFVADWWASTREQGFFQRAEELHAEKANAAGEQGHSKESRQEHADRYTTWLASFPEPLTEATTNAKRPQEAAVRTAEEYRLDRVENAEKALSVYMDQNREARVTDCLADLMHWSREKGIDFYRCLEQAAIHYRAEVNKAEEELSRKAEKHEEHGIER